MISVSTNIILDALREAGYSFDCSIEGKRSFTWTAFSDGSELEADPQVLYVCADGISRRNDDSNYYCICITDSRPEDAHTIAVHTGDSPFQVFRTVHSCFREMQRWGDELINTIQTRPDYQTIVDLSENILGNSLYILDPSLKLLACTQNIVDDDIMDIKLREKGYHADDTISRFRDFGVFQQYNTSTDFRFTPPMYTNKYATASKWIRDGSTPALSVVMVCNNVDFPSDGLVDKLTIFISHCEKCMHRKKSQVLTEAHSYSSLLTDVLYAGFNRPKLIDERARTAGLPITGEFHILKVMLRDSSYYHIPRLMSEIEHILPTAKIIVHEYEGVILSYSNVPLGKEAFRNKINSIYGLLKERQAICGVSEPFSLLHDMASAFGQASRALAIGSSLHAAEKQWNSSVGNWDRMGVKRDDTVFYYRDIAIYYMASVANVTDPYIYQGLECMNKVENIIASDKNRGSNDAQVLFTYLMCERNSAKTGEKLHMHRNNVLYRISKIREQYQLDMDDYWIRTGLLLSYHYLELHQANALAEQNT